MKDFKCIYFGDLVGCVDFCALFFQHREHIGRIAFSIILIFLSKSEQKIHEIFEKSLNSFNFSRIFSFTFLLILMHFLKMTLNLRVLPNSKISFRPSKIGPPKHLVDPLNTKFLHKLLQGPRLL